MIRDTKGIPVLDKIRISTREVVLYLESINIANEQILSVLTRKPMLPEYEKLDWFAEFRINKVITRKLKGNKKLNEMEKKRLTETLTDAAFALKKLRGIQGINGKTIGLENYIKKLVSAV